jgi:hypothetical protein
MGNWFSGMFKGRQAARPATPEPPTPSPAERAKDLQTQLDEEYRAMVQAANEAFIAELRRTGLHWPGDSSPGLQEHRARLREARGGRRW